jgi:transcriptional regulator with XRE-family HTH domain
MLNSGCFLVKASTRASNGLSVFSANVSSLESLTGTRHGWRVCGGKPIVRMAGAVIKSLPRVMTGSNARANIVDMAANTSGNLAHFGNQMRKERLARGWSLRVLSAQTGLAYNYLSQIENGTRPPTARVADAMDAAMPERKGWFREYYDDNRSSIPPGLRSWAEHEDKASRLGLWAVSVVHGLLQTPDYARVWIETVPGVTPEQIDARLASRMARQKRVLFREDPPAVTCIVDHTALYRLVGSPDVMAEQLRHLLEVASMPHVTLHVMPAVAHHAVTSEMIIADHRAVYTEDLSGGRVHEGETAARLDQLLTTIASEAYRASDSAAIIRKAEQAWTGEQPVTAQATDRASKSRRAK